MSKKSSSKTTVHVPNMNQEFVCNLPPDNYIASVYSVIPETRDFYMVLDTRGKVQFGYSQYSIENMSALEAGRLISFVNSAWARQDEIPDRYLWHVVRRSEKPWFVLKFAKAVSSEQLLAFGIVDMHKYVTQTYILREVFNFTAAESEIAVDLVNFKTAREIAALRGTSIETVRDQIKQISEKMGFKRLPQLVRFMSVFAVQCLSHPPYDGVRLEDL